MTSERCLLIVGNSSNQHPLKIMGGSRLSTTARSLKKQVETSFNYHQERQSCTKNIVYISNSKKPTCQLIAWRFLRSITLSIPPQVTLDLIPLETSGTPNVGGMPVDVGKSIHLTKDVGVRPSFVCLVRVYGSVPKKE